MQIYHDPEKCKFGCKCVTLGNVLGRFIEYTCVGMRERYREVAPPHTPLRPVHNMWLADPKRLALILKLYNSCAPVHIVFIAIKT